MGRVARAQGSNMTEPVKVIATILGMGVEVDPPPLDPHQGDVYVLLRVRVEDARKLAPVMGSPAAFQVVLSEASD